MHSGLCLCSSKDEQLSMIPNYHAKFSLGFTKVAFALIKRREATNI